jgi:4-hydroxybenzoate polyprenyltransferase
MKRITFWPQLFLGIIFNFGVIICSFEFYEKLIIEYLILYLSCILWTIGYDTIYAYQDLKDDKTNKIKSTAVLFGNYGKLLVVISYTLMLALIGYLKLTKAFGILSFAVFLIIFIYILTNLLQWNIESKESSEKKFRQNNLFGAMIFLYLLSF